MRDPDLPLFAWNPSNCVVLAFPQNKRIGRAREVARAAFSMSEHPRKVEAYRRRILEELVRMLTDRGVVASEATSQSIAFDRIVDREFARLQTMRKLGLLDESGGAA